MRQTVLNNPHTRGLIVRKLAQSGHWSGRRGSYKLAFTLSDQPTLQNERVTWRARIAREWISGVSGTVAEGLDAIQRQARISAGPKVPEPVGRRVQ